MFVDGFLLAEELDTARGDADLPPREWGAVVPQARLEWVGFAGTRGCIGRRGDCYFAGGVLLAFSWAWHGLAWLGLALSLSLPALPCQRCLALPCLAFLDRNICIPIVKSNPCPDAA